jgi:hypothetical protein
MAMANGKCRYSIVTVAKLYVELRNALLSVLFCLPYSIAGALS